MTTNILAPVDLMDLETSKKVLDSAVAQTQMSEGHLTVMTVVPDIIAGLDWRYAIRGETGGSGDLDMSKIVQEALERLNKVVSDLTPEGMKVTTLARRGSVYEQVLNVAEEIKADQIVMGAHRPGLSDFLLGPNTARVVRHATCSVNVVRL
ncbi:MAG: universal stress protein [Kiloniellales bacterium]